MPDTTNDEMGDEMSRELNTLAAAYALDAVSGDERLLLESRLPDYPELEREIGELRTAAALLADPVTAVPPAWLRQSVLTQISGIRQLPPLVESASSAALPAAVTSGTDAPPASVTDLAERRAHRAGRLAGWRRSLAVGAVAAAVAAGAVVVGYQSVGSPAPSASSVLSQPDVQSTTVSVAGGSGRAVVAWSASERKAVLYLNALSSAPTGRTYQLWLIKGTAALSEGTFTPSGTSTQLGVDGLSAGDKVAVTLEPAGGSKQPTTQPIIAVPLT